MTLLQGGVTELEVHFAPEGGFNVPAKWRANGGQAPASADEISSRDDIDNFEPREFLEGTATLEVVIADGSMRGLPVVGPGGYRPPHHPHACGALGSPPPP